MKRHIAPLGIAVAFLTAVWDTTLRAQPSVQGQWTNVFSWGTGGGVEAIHISLLPTGKVMFWATWRESVGLWNPATSQFSTAPFPSMNPFCSGHAWLPDGRLMVVGGHISNYNGEPRADIYDPFTNTWASSNPGVPDVPDMGTSNTNPTTTGKRWYPGATTLTNGDVLVLSGDVSTQGGTNRRVQVYGAATNTWTELTGALRPSGDLLPEYPRTFLTPDGRAVSLSDNSNDTEFLNLSGTGSWTYLQDTLDSNMHNYGPAVMYDAGKVAFIGGGNNPTDNINLIDFNSPTPSWSYNPESMAQGRRQNNATILADGTVFINGGTSVAGWNDANGLVVTPEIWDPVTGDVTQVASANASIYRGYHSASLLLPDGRVLVTGGDHDTFGYTQNTNAEIYSPSYLFNGARPTVTSAPDTVERGGSYFIATPNAADIADVTFIVPGSVTHAQDWTQRADHLEFTEVDGGISVSIPENPHITPLGYYMLFLVNDNGVPALAEWVRVMSTMPGDLDDDNDVDANDINLLADMIFRGSANPGAYDTADLNGDGAIDQDDLDQMVGTILGTTYGDADLDGDVDGADFDAWRIRDSLGGGIGWATGDFDGDNDVDGADFDHWRERLPAIGGAGVVAVPEPAGIALLGLGAFLCLPRLYSRYKK